MIPRIERWFLTTLGPLGALETYGNGLFWLLFGSWSGDLCVISTGSVTGCTCIACYMYFVHLLVFPVQLTPLPVLKLACSARNARVSGWSFVSAQVVDLGVMRLISNDLSLYAEWVSKNKGRLVHGDFATTMRSSCLRFKHACRVERVPHFAPGYV